MGWDGHYRATSRGALAYEFFLFAYIRALYAEEYKSTPLWRVTEVVGLEWKVLPDLERYSADRLRPSMIAGLDAAVEAPETYENCGDAHRLQLVHPFSAIPGVGSQYRYGNYPTGGSTQTLMKRDHKRTGKSYAALYGAGTRILADLSDMDNTYVVLLGGQDGWLNSANFLDQVPLWLWGEYILLPLRPQRIKARSIRTMTIVR